MRTFYIATNFDNQRAASQLSRQLEAFGWVNLCKWWRLKEEDSIQVAIKEVAAIKTADILVVILPGYLGTHTELGIAIGQRKPIIICGETLEAFQALHFYHLPGIYHIMDTVDNWPRKIKLTAQMHGNTNIVERIQVDEITTCSQCARLITGTSYNGMASQPLCFDCAMDELPF